MKGGTLALEGFETRLWTVRDPAHPARLKSALLPAEVRAAFGAPPAGERYSRAPIGLMESTGR